MDFYKRAKKLYSERNFTEAIEYYEKCVKDCYDDEKEMKYDLPECLFNIGMCYISMINYPMGIDYINEALCYREDAKYYFKIGCCFNELKLKNSALENFMIANAISPEDKIYQDAVHEYR